MLRSFVTMMIVIISAVSAQADTRPVWSAEYKIEAQSNVCSNMANDAQAILFRMDKVMEQPAIIKADMLYNIENVVTISDEFEVWYITTVHITIDGLYNTLSTGGTREASQLVYDLCVNLIG